MALSIVLLAGFAVVPNEGVDDHSKDIDRYTGSERCQVAILEPAEGGEVKPNFNVVITAKAEDPDVFGTKYKDSFVCVSLDSQPYACYPISSMKKHPRFVLVSEGTHTLEAKFTNATTSALIDATTSGIRTFSVTKPNNDRAVEVVPPPATPEEKKKQEKKTDIFMPKVVIIAPQEGSSVYNAFNIHLVAESSDPDQFDEWFNNEYVCFSLDDADFVCYPISTLTSYPRFVGVRDGPHVLHAQFTHPNSGDPLAESDSGSRLFQTKGDPPKTSPQPQAPNFSQQGGTPATTSHANPRRTFKPKANHMFPVMVQGKQKMFAFNTQGTASELQLLVDKFSRRHVLSAHEAHRILRRTLIAANSNSEALRTDDVTKDGIIEASICAVDWHGMVQQHPALHTKIWEPALKRLSMSTQPQKCHFTTHLWPCEKAGLIMYHAPNLTEVSTRRLHTLWPGQAIVAGYSQAATCQVGGFHHSYDYCVGYDHGAEWIDRMCTIAARVQRMRDRHKTALVRAKLHVHT